MGARLRYGKVVDRQSFINSGGAIHPGLKNEVELPDGKPGAANPFYVLRAWDDVDTGFTETWRIMEPEGRTVRTSAPREVLASHGDLSDEVEDAEFDFPADGYQLVLEIDGREVARVEFPVKAGVPPTSQV